MHSVIQFWFIGKYNIFYCWKQLWICRFVAKSSSHTFVFKLNWKILIYDRKNGFAAICKKLIIHWTSRLNDLNLILRYQCNLRISLSKLILRKRFLWMDYKNIRMDSYLWSLSISSVSSFYIQTRSPCNIIPSFEHECFQSTVLNLEDAYEISIRMMTVYLYFSLPPKRRII